MKSNFQSAWPHVVAVLVLIASLLAIFYFSKYLGFSVGELFFSQ